MYIHRRNFIVLFISFLVFSLLPVSPVRANEVIFGDPAVEQAVRKDLGLPIGPISENHMRSLQYIVLPAGEAKSLKGLEYAVNMEYISIAENQIEDISPLSHMPKLRQLHMPGNKVSDLSPLASLEELTDIYMPDNQIKDVSPLSGLEKLNELILRNNQIVDLTPLSSLTSLKLLEVNNNSIRSIEAVRSMKSLETFNFANNEVEDLEPLQDLRNLTGVWASQNKIDLNEAKNKSTLQSLRQRNVNLSGIENQKQEASPPKSPEGLKLTWSNLYGEPKDEDYHTNKYAFGNGIYVSAEGYTSKDGINWKKNPKFEGIRLNHIIWGKGLFVGIGYGKRDEIPVYTSKDGVNWMENEQKIKSKFSLNGVAFNGTRFVAVGGHNAAGTIYTSEDGLKWTERKSGMETDLKGIAWGNGTFVALGYQGGVFTVSKDGLTWKKVTVPVNYSMWDIGFAGGSFVAVGDQALITSKDGVKWNSVPSNGVYWSTIIIVKDRFFIEGGKNAGVETVAVKRTSKDGKQWSDLVGFGPQTTKGYDRLTVVHDGKQYISYTGTGVFTSVDGIKWKQIKKIPLKPFRLTRSAVGEGKLVAVGGTVDSFDPDVEKLAYRGLLQIDSSGAYKYSQEKGKFPLWDVIWTGKQFFAVGHQGLMMTSKDGLTWEKAASPTKESLYRIIQAKGTYYAVGDNGTILTSKDLKKWTKQKTGVTGAINSIAWNGKTFVAVGQRGLMLLSDNGTTWTKIKRNADYNCQCQVSVGNSLREQNELHKEPLPL